MLEWKLTGASSLLNKFRVIADAGLLLCIRSESSIAIRSWIRELRPWPGKLVQRQVRTLLGPFTALVRDLLGPTTDSQVRDMLGSSRLHLVHQAACLE